MTDAAPLPPCPVCGYDNSASGVLDCYAETSRGEVEHEIVECASCLSEIPIKALRASPFSKARQLDNDIITALLYELHRIRDRQKQVMAWALENFGPIAANRIRRILSLPKDWRREKHAAKVAKGIADLSPPTERKAR